MSSCSSVRLRGIGHERVHAAVREHDRPVGEPRHVAEARLVQVRDVDHHAQLVAGADELAARWREAGTRVRRPREAERDAVAERVRAAPDDPERAQPALVPRVEVPESGLDRLRALEMQDRAGLLAGETALQLGDRPHEEEIPLRDRRDLVRDALGALERQRLLHRHLVALGGAHDERARIGRGSVLGRDEDGEEAGGDPALAHPRQIEAALVVAFAQRAAGPPDAQQRVVVAVDDRDHASSPGSSEYIAQSTRRPSRGFQYADRSTPSSRNPAFSATRRDASLPTAARSWTRAAPAASAHATISRTASVVTPRPRASARSQYPISATSRDSFQVAPIDPSTRPPSASVTAKRVSRSLPAVPRM